MSADVVGFPAAARRRKNQQMEVVRAKSMRGAALAAKQKIKEIANADEMASHEDE
jgi:hypothetical protein